jgi:hypothetical protein
MVVMGENDEQEIEQSRNLWNVIHDAIAGAMRMDQPEPENPMLGDRTATNQTLKLFTKMKELGYGVVVPEIGAPKMVATASLVEPVKASIPQVIFKSTLGKVGEGVKGFFRKVVGEETKTEG